MEDETEAKSIGNLKQVEAKSCLKIEISIKDTESRNKTDEQNHSFQSNQNKNICWKFC